jgi:hypothetical protein
MRVMAWARRVLGSYPRYKVSELERITKVASLCGR